MLKKTLKQVNANESKYSQEMQTPFCHELLSLFLGVKKSDTSLYKFKGNHFPQNIEYL